MARNTDRLTRHRGFLTLWALFFLMSVSLLLSVVSVGLTARRETTTDLIRTYAQGTQTIEKQTTTHVKEAAHISKRLGPKRDSPQRLLE